MMSVKWNFILHFLFLFLLHWTQKNIHFILLWREPSISVSLSSTVYVHFIIIFYIFNRIIFISNQNSNREASNWVKYAETCILTSIGRCEDRTILTIVGFDYMMLLDRWLILQNRCLKQVLWLKNNHNCFINSQSTESIVFSVILFT